MTSMSFNFSRYSTASSAFSGSTAAYPRITIAGLYPWLRSFLTIQVTRGVLPVPPTVTFPTAITGSAAE